MSEARCTRCFRESQTTYGEHAVCHKCRKEIDAVVGWLDFHGMRIYSGGQGRLDDALAAKEALDLEADIERKGLQQQVENLKGDVADHLRTIGRLQADARLLAFPEHQESEPARPPRDTVEDRIWDRLTEAPESPVEAPSVNGAKGKSGKGAKAAQ